MLLINRYTCITVLVKGFIMSHYDDFEAAKKYNENLEKKYVCLVPKGNTADLLSHDTIDDALGFCADGVKSIDNPDYPTIKFSDCMDSVSAKKGTNGKAEGARYCFLSSIASASHYAGCAEDQIGKYLDQLIDFDFRGECSTQHIFNMIEAYCAIAMDSHKKLWDGVIAVRMHGLESGKYTIENHKLPMDKDLLLDAAARHLISYLYMDQIDEESGQNHMCHIMANILMFAAQLNIEKGE